MSATELREWMVLSSIEPWGEVRADLRAAVVAREVRMSMTTSKKKWTLMDFMPILKAEQEREEKDNAHALAMKINAFMFARPHVIINQPRRK